MQNVAIVASDQRVGHLIALRAPKSFSVRRLHPASDRSHFIDVINAADHAIIYNDELPAGTIQAGTRLKHAVLLAAEHSNGNETELQTFGVQVDLCSAVSPVAVAEHSIAILLALYKKLADYAQAARTGAAPGHGNGFDTFLVAGKTVGIVGVGKVGRSVARRLAAFDARIIYSDPYASAEDLAEFERETGARSVDIEDLLSLSDVISLHLPLTGDSRGMIGARAFALMKSNAVVINPSRSEIVDEVALIDALKSHRIAGVGIDVLTSAGGATRAPIEPLHNLICTPHVAGCSSEIWSARIDAAWNQIDAFH